MRQPLGPFEVRIGGTQSGVLVALVAMLNLMATAAASISFLLGGRLDLFMARLLTATLNSVVMMRPFVGMSALASRVCACDNLDGGGLGGRLRLLGAARRGPASFEDATADAAGGLEIGSVLVKRLCQMGAAGRGRVLSVLVMGVVVTSMGLDDVRTRVI